MHSKKQIGRKRLIKLLSICKISGVKLSKMTGAAYPLFLKVHGGERQMTPRYAELIAIATGISPEWLLGDKGALKNPIGLDQKPYTKQSFDAWGKKAGQQEWSEITASKKFSLTPYAINGMSWEIAKTAIAAARKNRFWIVQHLFNGFVRDLQKTLEIESLVHRESVNFLPENPHATNLGSLKNECAQGKLPEYNVIRGDSEKIDGVVISIDIEESREIAETFNPTFLFRLGEAMSEANKDAVGELLTQAERSLQVVKSHLLSAAKTPIRSDTARR